MGLVGVCRVCWAKRFTGFVGLTGFIGLAVYRLCPENLAVALDVPDIEAYLSWILQMPTPDLFFPAAMGRYLTRVDPF